MFYLLYEFDFSSSHPDGHLVQDLAEETPFFFLKHSLEGTVSQGQRHEHSIMLGARKRCARLLDHNTFLYKTQTLLAFCDRDEVWCEGDLYLSHICRCPWWIPSLCASASFHFIQTRDMKDFRSHLVLKPMIITIEG